MVAGIVLTLATFALARRRSTIHPGWLAAFAVMVTMAAEALVELAEYPILIGNTATRVNYYDTIADIGATLGGALVAAALAVIWSTAHRRD